MRHNLRACDFIRSTGLLVFLVGMGIWSFAAAGIATDPTPASEGESTRILVTTSEGSPVAGAEVVVVYRPGSQVENQQTVGTTGTDGSIPWTPIDAGLVSLQTTNPADSSAISANLAVRYSGVPTPGLSIMILSGAILFGGMIRGFRALKDPPPNRPPDT